VHYPLPPAAELDCAYMMLPDWYGVAMEEVAQPLGHRQHPLPHGEAWQDVIRKMRRGFHHAPAVARWADASALARERDQEVVPALPAPRPGKAMGQDAALQIATELPVHMRRHRPVVIVALATVGERGLRVSLDAAIEHALARAARLVLPGAPSLVSRSSMRSAHH
jgi:hypothetical protein